MEGAKEGTAEHAGICEGGGGGPRQRSVFSAVAKTEASARRPVYTRHKALKANEKAVKARCICFPSIYISLETATARWRLSL